MAIEDDVKKLQKDVDALEARVKAIESALHSKLPQAVVNALSDVRVH